MNENMNVETGHLSFLASIFLGIFSWFGDNMDLAIRILTVVATLATASFAIVNYYYSIKKNRLQIEDLEEENK